MDNAGRAFAQKVKANPARLKRPSGYSASSFRESKVFFSEIHRYVPKPHRQVPKPHRQAPKLHRRVLKLHRRVLT